VTACTRKRAGWTTPDFSGTRKPDVRVRLNLSRVQQLHSDPGFAEMGERSMLILIRISAIHRPLLGPGDSCVNSKKGGQVVDCEFV
jgi:hypothetical protein